MRFEINLKNSFSENRLELEKTFDFFTIKTGENVFVMNNVRVEQHFKSNKINLQNIVSILPHYLEYGLVIIIDKINESITIFNDIYGAFPLFLETNENSKIIKNSFQFDPNKTLNKLAIVQLLHFNHLLGKNTLNIETEKISGGQKIIVDKKGYSIIDFFTWNDYVNEIQKGIKVETRVLMNAAINESLKSKTNPILTLTGGFDSRLLLGLLLQQKSKFSTITWGAPNNNQTSRAQEISSEFKIDHTNINLDEHFKNEVPRILNYILKNGTENPFITDIPQFIYMCEKLDKNSDLISGFMGSEIIRGPSYSSQVTLTKFAADIGLSTSKEEIKELILKFNAQFPYISQSFIDQNMNELIEEYSSYSKIGLVNTNQKNSNIFKYLFYEKYPKIYGPIIRFHHDLNINLINPYLDFTFIVKTLRENKALSEMTPYENGSLNNFYSYRFYAKEMKKIFPGLLHTKMDRGYKLKDLISTFGIMKLIPYQVYRKFKNKNIPQIKVVDSNSWYAELIQNNVEINQQELKHVLNSTYINENRSKINTMTDLDKIKFQLILGLLKKMKC